MIRETFSAVKAALARIVGQKASLRAAIDVKKMELKKLSTLPLPQADYADAVCESIDRRADQWDEGFLLTIAPTRGCCDFSLDIPLLESNGSYSKPGVTFPAPIYAIFRDTIKTAVHARIMGLEWPAEVGPSRADRALAIARVNKELALLEQQYIDLMKSAADAGVRID